MSIQVKHSSSSNSTSPSSVFEGALSRPGHPHREAFYEISLPLPEKHSNIEQCVKEFFSSDENYNGTKIIEVPDILVLDLKRFQFDRETKRVIKV